MPVRARPPLTRRDKIATLLVPWLFLGAFVAACDLVLVPHLSNASPLVVAVATLVAVTFVSFAAAAITFTRDVLTGHYS